jgi:type IV/VI secretion system ImpK/VasF family protein
MIKTTNNSLRKNAAKNKKPQNFNDSATIAPINSNSGICSYDSLILNASTGVNPLTTAAAPLFTLAGRLKNHDCLGGKAQLFNNLVYEIQVFINKAKKADYSADTIINANYALCCLLDELISNTPWGKANKWNNNLLMEFHQKKSGDTNFFLILTKLQKTPAIYLDLLEFMHMCLILGFTGKYRNSTTKGNINDVINSVYQCINNYRRVNSASDIEHATKSAIGTTSENFAISRFTKIININHTAKYKILAWCVAAIILVNIFIYIGLNWRLNTLANNNQTSAKYDSSLTTSVNLGEKS